MPIMDGLDASKIALVGMTTSLLSKLVTKHLGQLDTQVHTGLTTLVTIVMSWLMTQDLYPLLSAIDIWQIGYLSLGYAFYLVLKSTTLHRLILSFFYSKTQPAKENKTHSLSLHSLASLSALTSYIKQNALYFPSVNTFSQGDHLTQPLYGVASSCSNIHTFCKSLESLSYPALNVKHPIEDPSLKGSMTWSLEFSEVDCFFGQNTAKISLPRFTVRIESEYESVSTINKFVDKINMTNKQNTVSKNLGVTLLPDKLSDGGMYRHFHHLPPLPPLDDEALARFEFNSFFHPQRAEILMMLVTVHFNKDMLLAKGLSASLGILAHGPPGCGKSLLGFKIARALKRIPISVDLQCVSNIRQAYQVLYSPYISNSFFDPSEVVVMMDEFDEVVTQLHDKERRFSQLTDPREEPKSPVFNPDQETLQDQLTINGLLKLLQGPLPNDGSIKVASTNKLDLILDIRAAIAREGRLTPLQCTYPNKVVVDQMSNHYFGVPFDEDIPHLEGTPTSALTARASSLMVKYNDDLVEGARVFHQEILEIADRL